MFYLRRRLLENIHCLSYQACRTMGVDWKVLKTNTFDRVSHVIFDCDGLLLDTEKFYFQVNQSICELYGESYTWELGEKAMGSVGIDAAKLIIETLNLPVTPNEYCVEARKRQRQLFPDAELKPDSEKCYEKIYCEIAKKYGKIYTWEIKMKLMGTTERDSASIMVQELKLPLNVEEFVKLQHDLEKRLLPQVLLLPGAEKLLLHLHNHKVPFAMATSSSLESMELKSTKHKELFSLFHHIVSGSSDPDVKYGKPAPDIYLVCASRFPETPSPAECLVFEDAPNGVAAAHSAGMQVVMVPDPRVSQEKRTLATLILSSLEEFQPELFGLPSYAV